MTSTIDAHEFLDSDGGSDDEAPEFFCELEAVDEGPLQECHSQDNVNNGMNFTKPSVESVSVGNWEPYTGMTFSSLDSAREFYYEYARQTGFTIRTNKTRHSLKNMAVIGRDFVCSREGFRHAKQDMRKDRVLPPRPVTREGCKAMIRLAARHGEKWVVTKFVREHNHKLMSHSKFHGELPTINILNKEEKDKKIQDLSDQLKCERERSAALQQQLHMILKDLEEHAEFMSLRVEDIVNKLKEIGLGYL